MAKQTKKYEESIQEIERIIQEIEQGEIGIDALTDKIKEAMELIEFCKTKLQATEQEIQSILDEKK